MKRSLDTTRSMGWTVPACCVGWATFIFATSSTVVTPDRFFLWINDHVFHGADIFLRFQLFWGASWYIIVKGWHVTEFAVLMWLVTRVIDRFTSRESIADVGWGMAITVLYAASDEWHQTFVPRRGGIVSDVVIDCIGILAVAIVLWHRRRKQVGAETI